MIASIRKKIHSSLLCIKLLFIISRILKDIDKKYIFAVRFGGLAHLARALAWQARGGRFESDILHKKS
jgi:hypothetical protein